MVHCEDHDDDDERLAHHAPSDDANAGCAPCTRAGQRHISISDADRAVAQELGITHDDVLSNIGDRPHHCDDCDDDDYHADLKRVLLASHYDQECFCQSCQSFRRLDTDDQCQCPNPCTVNLTTLRDARMVYTMRAQQALYDDDDDDQALSADLPLPW